jgi:S-formylglutathione hydrolase FrmB
MEKEIAYVINLPDDYESNEALIFPVLYCLHGYGAPYDTWAVMKPLNDAIDGNYPAIIVTFEGSTHSYVDYPDDPSVQYTRFFFKELVPFVESNYRAGRAAGRRGITGFSMGGYGALHLTLERPDFFSAASAVSGAFDREPGGQADLNLMTRIPALSETEAGALPPLYLNCGAEDRFLEGNRKMAAFLSAMQLDYHYVETGRAGHNWPFWRDLSDDVLQWHYQFFHEIDPTSAE